MANAQYCKQDINGMFKICAGPRGGTLQLSDMAYSVDVDVFNNYATG